MIPIQIKHMYVKSFKVLVKRYIYIWVGFVDLN